ncbi:ATPase associated with various cellular activities AAA_3 [Leadbetterella byssophila DSM 17132]|jgi:MoxR-like ATPase|uniref:ATPase associated with various cellular activities AAA_3 n=1 Tax=Leadbetterella byssophila (strain DSM 17132 / JCM 16389 / KACC 11308 / NBRC 106382 / 4M15) TaxID=649349 RepID=E4RU70_LEAB4|nr:MoxR family ATPase [Leadbetterella byssophila]ADQ16904.1 ATPase associated with various cellular activities AAA_3 [Leadbetterella byssophila DSM 17132]
MKSDVEAADALKKKYEELSQEIGKVIVGQEETVKLLLTAVFCQGHCLLVGVPGLAKTLLVQTIASALDLDFNRIQFTPDLMPSDITGSETLDNQRNFKFVKGPVFANIILADEINRTPPKTQSALLEAMQEYAVTVSGQKHNLSRPFFVLATQNPIEQEGTYPLPEAQLDRFMFMVSLDYPTLEQEMQIVKNTTSSREVSINKVLGAEEIVEFQQLIRKVPVSDHVIEYAVKLVQNTRPGIENASTQAKTWLEWGAGPRASQNLILAAKCNALFQGKYSPDIDDVKAVAYPILRHRIVRNFKAEAEGITTEKIIGELL